MRDYAEDYGQSVYRLGPETAAKFPKIDKDFGDRVGIGVRVMEQEAFRARKVGGRFLQNASGGISDWLRALF